MFIWYLNDSLVAKTFYKSLVDGVQADSMTKLRNQNHLWSVKPIYCRKKKNKHDIFAGLGSVHIVKNCDLGPEMAERDTDRGQDFPSQTH